MMLSAYLSPSRHGIYYFRWPLPRIEDHKRTTVRVSLRTRCPDRAGDLARYLASCGRLMRDSSTLAGLRQSELRDKVQAYFKAQLDQYIDRLDRHGLRKSVLEHAREEMLDHESFVELGSADPLWVPATRFKRKMEISESDWQANLPRIIYELRKGRRDMLKAVLETVDGQDSYSYGDAVARPSPAPERTWTPLGRAVQEFIEEHSRQWTKKTQTQVKAYLGILVEYFGPDRLLNSISKQDASEVKKVLQALPSSRNTKPSLKDLTLLEVIKIGGHEKLTPKTINGHIDAFRRFFDWAERHGHSPHKMFEGMKVPKAKDSATQRKPFTKEQINLILKEATDNPLGLIRNKSHKWGMLLGLYTGARLNEICQLEIKDVYREGDLWYLKITDDGDNKKRLKAKASRRSVPIHSELLRLGFVEFYNTRKEGARLFPDYSYNENGGYGRNLGRWFNESFLPSLKVKEPGLVFHCFRHTMVTRLEQAGVPEPIIQFMIGHAREGVTQAVYFQEGYTIEQLKIAIENFHG